jgi:DNA repair exonuclease SbcCD ATPase subunit
MNITYLNEPFNFVAPDPAIVGASRTELERRLINRDTFYLPVIKHQLNNLSQLLHQLDDHARQLLAATPVALQTQELAMMLGKMRESSGIEQKSLAASVSEKYQAEISDIVESSLGQVAEYAVTLSELLDSLSAWKLPDVASFIADQNHQAAARQSALNALNAECAELEARKQQINDAMKIYDERTVFDRWTPILEDAARLRLSSPAMATLQAAAIGVMNIFNIASEMVKYGDLVDARNHLQSSLDGKYAQVADFRKQLKALALRSEQLGVVQGIEQPRARYEHELRKLANALETFLSLRQRKADVSAIDYARAFTTQADALAGWMRVVLKNWK